MHTKTSLDLTDAKAIATAAQAYAASHQLAVPIAVVDGRCAGAIGVAGVLPEHDAAIAEAGLTALGSSDWHEEVPMHVPHPWRHARAARLAVVGVATGVTPTLRRYGP